MHSLFMNAVNETHFYEFLQARILKNIMTSDSNMDNILELNRKINGFSSAYEVY